MASGARLAHIPSTLGTWRASWVQGEPARDQDSLASRDELAWAAPSPPQPAIDIVRAEESTLSVHRLVQEIVRLANPGQYVDADVDADGGGAPRAYVGAHRSELATFAEAVSTGQPRRHYDRTTWATTEALAPHMNAAA